MDSRRAGAFSDGVFAIAISCGFASVWLYVVRHAPRLGAAVPQNALRRPLLSSRFRTLLP